MWWAITSWVASRLTAGSRFVPRCMSYTLLHEFYIERPTYPGLSNTVRTLEELATLVWDLDARGLPGSDS